MNDTLGLHIPDTITIGFDLTTSSTGSNSSYSTLVMGRVIPGKNAARAKTLTRQTGDTFRLLNVLPISIQKHYASIGRHMSVYISVPKVDKYKLRSNVENVEIEGLQVMRVSKAGSTEATSVVRHPDGYYLTVATYSIMDLVIAGHVIKDGFITVPCKFAFVKGGTVPHLVGVGTETHKQLLARAAVKSKATDYPIGTMFNISKDVITHVPLFLTDRPARYLGRMKLVTSGATYSKHIAHPLNTTSLLYAFTIEAADGTNYAVFSKHPPFAEIVSEPSTAMTVDEGYAAVMAALNSWYRKERRPPSSSYWNIYGISRTRMLIGVIPQGYSTKGMRLDTVECHLQHIPGGMADAADGTIVIPVEFKESTDARDLLWYAYYGQYVTKLVNNISTTNRRENSVGYGHTSVWPVTVTRKLIIKADKWTLPAFPV